MNKTLDCNQLFETNPLQLYYNLKPVVVKVVIAIFAIKLI
jgi:hypothetical protein